MSATLAELEARIAALEATQADYRAVMATVNALSTQTRDRVNERFDEMRGYVDGRFNEAERTAVARHRSVEEHLAELKDLILQLRDT